MDIKEGGYHFEKLSLYDNFGLCKHYITKDDLVEAYNLANEKGNQMPRELTMYLIKEHGYPFGYQIFSHIDFVPKNFLYEAQDEQLVINIPENVKEIQDFAFSYCSIKKVVIPNTVEKIGDNALCLNSGEICYLGTKQEFIDKFLGKSKCFAKTKGQQVVCNNGIIEIKK